MSNIGSTEDSHPDAISIATGENQLLTPFLASLPTATARGITWSRPSGALFPVARTPTHHNKAAGAVW